MRRLSQTPAETYEIKHRQTGCQVLIGRGSAGTNDALAWKVGHAYRWQEGEYLRQTNKHTNERSNEPYAQRGAGGEGHRNPEI